tara:strand:+ start:173 stop:919 length:747 start_codon:yes stop_codon:yes gene_type:complete
MNWLSRVFGNLGSRKSKYITPHLLDEDGCDVPKTPDEEQVDRRARTEQRLRGEGVPINPDLGEVTSERDANIRAPEEVADRLLALTLVAMKAEGMDHEIMLEIVKERKADTLFTSRERAFILNPSPSDADLEHFSKSYEAAWALVWALRLVREPLTTPRRNCDHERVISIVRDTPDLTVNALRDTPSVLDKLDLFMRYASAVQASLAEGKKPPSEIIAIVALERYNALSWLTHHEGREDWDEPVRLAS